MHIHLDNDKALLHLAKRCGLERALWTLIDHDDAIVSPVYKVQDVDGICYIVKTFHHAPHAQRELYGLQTFAASGLVPKVFKVIPADECVLAAIVMEYIPGVIGTKETFVGSVAYQAGKFLAQVHMHTKEVYSEVDGTDAFVHARDYFVHKHEKYFDECKPYLSAGLLERCKQYYRTHLYLLDSVSSACMVHRDFRPGNMIIRDESLVGVIDWAACKIGFAQEDFVALEHTYWPFNDAGKKSFLDGYKTVSCVPEYQEVMPLLRMMRALNIQAFLFKKSLHTGKAAWLYEYNNEYLHSIISE